MNAAVCCAQHPERESVLCDKPSPCTGYHANAYQRLVWGVQEIAAAPPVPAERRRYRDRGPGKGDIALIARRAR